MHAAILYNRDRRFAHAVLEIPRHGEARGLMHVEIEIRQDLISHQSGQIDWATRIASALQNVRSALEAMRT